MDKVLVLLATYNGEKYLEQQLDSILIQEDVEAMILVRDDGSSDHTQKILDYYRNKTQRICWYQGSHVSIQKGYYELMKKAFNSKYNYYAFSDQDDVWDKDKLKIGIEAIKKTNIPALYYCGQRIVDEKLQFIKNHELNNKRTLQTRFILSDFAGCTGVFNRHLLKEVIKYEPDYMLMHDTWILKVCLCLGGTVVVDTSSHMSYRQHVNNTIGLGKGFFSDLKQVKQYLNYYNVEKQMIELKKGYHNFMIYPYNEICDWICNYKKNKKYVIKLIDKDNVDFHNIGLNIVYLIKVLTKRL